MTDIQPKKKKNYLNNADMMIQIKLSLERDKMTDVFANMMIMLTDRYGNQPKFSSYSFLDDMKSYALYMVCRTWNRFDPNRSNNPFAFFTQCIKHSFYQYLNREKHQRNIRDALLVNTGMNPSNTFVLDYEQDRGDFDVGGNTSDYFVDNGGFDADYAVDVENYNKLNSGSSSKGDSEPSLPEDDGADTDFPSDDAELGVV